SRRPERRTWYRSQKPRSRLGRRSPSVRSTGGRRPRLPGPPLPPTRRRTASPSFLLQLRPEERDHRMPRAVGHLRPLTRPQEAVPHAGIDRVLIVLPRLLHRGGHLRQPRVDARVVFGVHPEALGADAGDVCDWWVRPVADDECLEGRVVRRVAEALAPAPAKPDHTDRV